MSIGLFDVSWQSAVYESEDLEEDEVVESGTDFLVGIKGILRFPLDDVILLFEIVDDDRAVLVVESWKIHHT